METKVSSKHMDVTAAIEEYAIRKAEKFERYFDRISQVEIIIDKGKNEYNVEILTDVEHHDAFVAHGKHEDLYACIDMAADRAIRQLTDHKSRLRDNKHHTPTSGNQT
jgi:putative sigma-54 modulation protein